MSERIIPVKVRLAAKRAAVRTWMQTAAATVPAGGISAVVLAQSIEDPNPVAIGAAVIAWASTPFGAALVAYLQVASSGIPDEYADAVHAIDADDPELL